MARPRNTVPTFRLVQRGGRFYVAWWADGRGHRVSTGTAEIQAARRFLADYAAGYASPAPPDAPTIGAILDGYLADGQGRVAAYATLEAACKALRRHLGDLGADALTRERSRFYARQRAAEGYEVGPADARRKKPVAAGTIARELVTLRAALQWARAEKWLTGDVPAVVVPPAAPPRDRWLTQEEAARLLAACRAAHVRLFVLLALHTGARAGAILALEWRAVDLRQRRINFGLAVGKKGRGVVPVNDALLPELVAAEAAAASGRVIETAAGEGVASIKTGVRAAVKRAGLAGVTPHTLRHTAATWAAQAGVEMRLIAGMLGHRDTATTEKVYAHHHPDYLRAVSGALAARFPGQLAPETAPAKKGRNRA